jgi:hypothetical protein
MNGKKLSKIREELGIDPKPDPFESMEVIEEIEEKNDEEKNVEDEDTIKIEPGDNGFEDFVKEITKGKKYVHPVPDDELPDYFKTIFEEEEEEKDEDIKSKISFPKIEKYNIKNKKEIKYIPKNYKPITKKSSNLEDLLTEFTNQYIINDAIKNNLYSKEDNSLRSSKTYNLNEIHKKDKDEEYF